MRYGLPSASCALLCFGPSSELISTFVATSVTTQPSIAMYRVSLGARTEFNVCPNQSRRLLSTSTSQTALERTLEAWLEAWKGKLSITRTPFGFKRSSCKASI